MKRIAVLTFIMGLLNVPIQAQAQQYFRGRPLAVGYAPYIVLTQEVADCQLDLVQFIAAEVRGVDLLQVTEETRQIWRNYLAYYYPKLAPADQNWFFIACSYRDGVTMMWPQASPIVRERYRQTWAASLPAILQFMEPVLSAAQQNAARRAIQNRDAVAAAQRDRQIADSLVTFNNRMNSLTTDLMRAMNGRR